MSIDRQCSRCGETLAGELSGEGCRQCGWGGQSPAYERLARLMPVCLSLALHTGLGMVLVFLGIFVSSPQSRAELIVPTVTPNGDREGGGTWIPKTLVKSDGHKGIDRFRGADRGEPTRAPRNRLAVDGDGTSGLTSVMGGMGPKGISELGGWGSFGPPSLGPVGMSPTKAPFVMFVIDRSGSMADTFDAVRTELEDFIRHLEPNQSFHVILLGEAQSVVENTPRKLVRATLEQKEGFRDFMEGVRPRGSTNPLPALTRAFDLLDQAGEGGKVLYLLTDGAFPDNDKVAALIKARNAGKKVRIDTFLYGNHSNEAQNLLERIAESSGGSYKYTSAGE